MNKININLCECYALNGLQIGGKIQSSIFDEGYAIKNTFGLWTKKQAISWLKLNIMHDYERINNK